MKGPDPHIGTIMAVLMQRWCLVLVLSSSVLLGAANAPQEPLVKSVRKNPNILRGGGSVSSALLKERGVASSTDSLKDESPGLPRAPLAEAIDGDLKENSIALPRAPVVDVIDGKVVEAGGKGEGAEVGEKVHARVPVSSVALLTLLMAVATGLGAVPFFFVELEQSWAGVCNGVACGVMLAASFGLVREGEEYGGGGECVVLGILAGGAFILISQKILEQYGDVHMMDLKGTDARRMVLVIAIMTLHSFGEGSGVGVSFAGPKGLPQGLLVTIAIAVHNIPEGLAVSMVMASRGVKPRHALLWSIFTSLPQPLVAVPAFMCAEAFTKFLPLCMGFAAGCMIWIVFGEVMPDAMKDASPGSVATAATISVAGMQFVSSFLKDLDQPLSLERLAPMGWSLLFSLGPFLGGLLLVTLATVGSLPPALLTGVASGAMLILAGWRPFQILAGGKMNAIVLIVLLYIGAVLYSAAVRLSTQWRAHTAKDRSAVLHSSASDSHLLVSFTALGPVARSTVVACAAVGLHALVEGLYLGVAAPRAEGLGMHMLLPVTLHGLPRGIAAAAAVYGTMGTPRGALLAAGLVGLGGPAGAMGAMMLQIDYKGLDYLMVLACGALAPAASASLLPRALALGRRAAVAGTLLGAAVVFTSLTGNRVLCNQTPYCNSAPEAVT